MNRIYQSIRRADRRLCANLAPPAFFLFLAAAVTWPLLLHLPDRVPGWYIADNYEYLWKMWWFRHALLDLHINPLVAPSILFPSGFPLAFGEITPLHTVVALPLTLAFGEVTSYNLLALASFVITGWAAYLLVLGWTGSPWAGLFAGILLVLNPYHLVRYGGILPSMAIEGLPVFLLGLERWIHSRKVAWIGVAALGYLLAAWAYVYYAFGLLLLGPVYVIARLATVRERLNDRRTLAHLGLLLLLILGFTVPLALPYLSLRESTTLAIPLQETDFWSASLTDYLVPPGLHRLWGNWVMRNALGVPEAYPQIALEFVLAGGYVALLFAVYGSVKSPVKGKRAVLVVTGLALLLSLGPRLHVARHPLVVPAPPAIVNGFNRLMDGLGGLLPAHEPYAPLAADGLTIPLPALLLRWLIQPLTGMRAWNRFAAFTSLGLSLLAGLGFAHWIEKELKPTASRLKARLLPLGFVALAMFELWPRSIPLQPVGPRPVDRWLAAQPDAGSIMELPLTSALSAPQMLYTRYHGKPIVFAFGTFLPYWYRQQYPELQLCPEPDCLVRLRSWGVSFVLLNLGDSGGPSLEAELNESPGLERLTRVGDHVVYRLKY